MDKIDEHLRSQFGSKASTFNVIRFRGDQTKVQLVTGEIVEKQDFIYVKDNENKVHAMPCADYHGEHFIYADPRYNLDGDEGRGHWFAMCTCGSPAVKIGWTDVVLTHGEGERAMIVCYVYMLTLEKEGVGAHMTGHRKWW